MSTTDRMIEGQPFAGKFIGSGIYYHTCLGYYNYLDSYPGSQGTSPCPSCGSKETDLTGTSGIFQLVGYCHSCKLVWENHNLTCDCKYMEFKQEQDRVVCANCGLEAESVEDMLYKLVG